MDFLTAIYTGLSAQTPITSIVGANIFKRKPNEVPAGPYLYFYQMKPSTRDVVGTKRIYFVVFSKDLEQLEMLCNAIQTYLHNNITFGNQSFMVRLASQFDDPTPTEEKFFFNSMTFEFFYTF